MKKTLYFIAILVLIPAVTHASWWNPISWFKKPISQPIVQIMQPVKQAVSEPAVEKKPVKKAVIVKQKTPAVSPATQNISTVIQAQTEELQKQRAIAQEQLDLEKEKKAQEEEKQRTYDKKRRELEQEYEIAEQKYNDLKNKQQAEIKDIESQSISLEFMEGKKFNVLKKYENDISNAYSEMTYALQRLSLYK